MRGFVPRQPNSKIPATFKKINFSYISQDGDLWAEEMEIPLTVIHNRISIHNRKVWKVFME